MFGAAITWFVTYSVMSSDIQQWRDRIRVARVDMCADVETAMSPKRGYVYPASLRYFCGYTDTSGRYHRSGEYMDTNGDLKNDPQFP